MALYADIIIDISHEKLDRTFQYIVPEELEQTLCIGMPVKIPFGNGNRKRKIQKSDNNRFSRCDGIDDGIRI